MEQIEYDYTTLSDILKSDGIEKFILDNKNDFNSEQSRRNNVVKAKNRKTGDKPPDHNYIDISSIIHDEYTTHNNDSTSIIVNNRMGLSFKKIIESFNPSIEYVGEDDIQYISTYDDVKDTIKDTIQKIVSSIEGINIIFITHIEDNEQPEFITSNYDPDLKNIYFYIHKKHKDKKNKKKNPNCKLELRLIVHIQLKPDGRYDMSHIHSPQISTDEGDSASGDSASGDSASGDSASGDSASVKMERTISLETDSESTHKSAASKVESMAPAPIIKPISAMESSTTTNPISVMESSPTTAPPSVTESVPNPTTYTYNPADIHELLPKYNITNNSNPEDTSRNGDYLIGNPYGYNNQYQNVYKEVKGSKKYTLSGRFEKKNDQSGKIIWFRL